MYRQDEAADHKVKPEDLEDMAFSSTEVTGMEGKIKANEQLTDERVQKVV